MANDLRAQQLKRAMASLNEFCVMCYRDMGFPKALHIDHARRSEDGACYHEGGGQCCGPCEKELAPSEVYQG